MAPKEHIGPEYWHLPGIAFSDKDEPMTHRLNIRSLLLQTWFCRAGKQAPRRDRFEVNLRAIFRSLPSFYDYACLGDQFWSAFAHSLCQYWDGALVKEVVHLYAGARRRYLAEHSHDREIGQMSNGEASIVKAIDIFLHRITLTSQEPSHDLRRAMEEALGKFNRKSLMWPPKKSSNSGDFSLSIKGLAARTDPNFSRRDVGQHPPDGPPSISSSSMRGAHELGDSNSIESPSLASRISAPSLSGSNMAVVPRNEARSPSDYAQGSPHNTLKRRPSLLVDTGPAKRRAVDENLITVPTPNQQPTTVEETPRSPIDSPIDSPLDSPGRRSNYTGEFDAKSPIDSPKDLLAHGQPKSPTPLEAAKQLEEEQIDKMEAQLTPTGGLLADKIEAQLTAFGELLGKRFDGIEAHVAAVQEQMSQNVAMRIDTAQTNSSPPDLPAHYVDEYLRSRDHNVLVKGVSDEIRRIRRYLLYGLRDHEHNQTSDAWKKLEGVWAALDEAEQRAN